MTPIVRNTGLTLALIAGLALAGCQEGGSFIDRAFPKAEQPISAELITKMKAKGMAASAPVMMRLYKQEAKLEVWKETGSGRYDLLETYDICKWSGKLGPKIKEGDRQAPEGFYTVNPYQMNPNSDYYLSFNMGFPNSFDRAYDRTGTYLMIHGACSSAGCYSMTDESIAEIYTLARVALDGGQKSFQIQAFPFRMTAENLAEHKDDPNFEFWTMLKQGSDHFEITKVPPKVDVCEKRYVFNRIAEDDKPFKAAEACPATTTPDSLALAYAEKISKDEKRFDEILKKKAFADRWKGIKPQPATEAIALADDPAPGISGETVAATSVIPVPEPSPRRAAEAALPEAPAKQGFFARLFAPKS